MKYLDETGGFALQRLKSNAEGDRFYSVEFSLEGHHYLHQFKIWNKAESSMSFLVKEDSKILNNLKAGDIITMKYYSINSRHPAKRLDTQIRDITKEDQGRFRGHYFVNFAIKDN